MIFYHRGGILISVEICWPNKCLRELMRANRPHENNING
jgi:hypothetical protein